MIITIDGPAGSGKSTVAGILAKKLGFIHFNSGALYRAIAVYLYEQNFDIRKMSAYTSIPDFNLKVKMLDGTQNVFINNKNYTSYLRENHISTLVTYIALNKECRQLVDECQRAFCSKNNIVIEGRDTGSFVFPNADFKFYLDCSLDIRAKRRLIELKLTNPNLTLEDMIEQLKARDNADKTREIAPLVVPKNAIIIDSSNLTVDEVVEILVSHIKL